MKGQPSQRRSSHRRATLVAPRPPTRPLAVDSWFRRGYLRTELWALDSRLVKDGPQTIWVRRPKLPQLYAGPDDSWRELWQRARLLISFQGQYQPAPLCLEVWTEHEGGACIQCSLPLSGWPQSARELLRRGQLTSGLVAVQTNNADEEGYPGLSIVLENGGSSAAGAKLLVNHLCRRGVRSCTAQRAQRGRWNVVKLIYAPNWYAADRERVFGVDWLRWRQTLGNDNENRRLWCENAVLIIAETLREIPSLGCDSLLFDEYAASDRLALLPQSRLEQLCQVNPDNLATELVQLNAEPVPPFPPPSPKSSPFLATNKAGRLLSALGLLDS